MDVGRVGSQTNKIIAALNKKKTHPASFSAFLLAGIQILPAPSQYSRTRDPPNNLPLFFPGMMPIELDPGMRPHMRGHMPMILITPMVRPPSKPMIVPNQTGMT